MCDAGVIGVSFRFLVSSHVTSSASYRTPFFASLSLLAPAPNVASLRPDRCPAFQSDPFGTSIAATLLKPRFFLLHVSATLSSPNMEYLGRLFHVLYEVLFRRNSPRLCSMVAIPELNPAYEYWRSLGLERNLAFNVARGPLSGTWYP